MLKMADGKYMPLFGLHYSRITLPLRPGFMKTSRFLIHFACLAVVAGSAPASVPSETPSLVVTTASDTVDLHDNQTSLREALSYAATLGGPQTITFAPALTAGAPAVVSLGAVGNTSYGPSALGVSNDVTILGPDGANGIILARDTGAAPGRLRLFCVESVGKLTLKNLTLFNGFAQGGNGFHNGGGGLGAGGAVVNAGTLTLVNCLFTGNLAQGGNGGMGGTSDLPGYPNAEVGGGGGMGADAPNDGSGGGPAGGAWNGGGPGAAGGFGGGGGAATSYLAGAGGFGGGGGGAGGYGYGGAGGFGAGGGGISINRQTGNPNKGGYGADGGVYGYGGAGAGLGGAVFNDAGTLTVVNCTFTGNLAIRGLKQNGFANTARGLGGAIFSRNGSVTLLHTTISGNSAAEGGRGVHIVREYQATASLQMDNCILGQADNSISDFFFESITNTFGQIDFNNPKVGAGTGNLIRGTNTFGGMASNADPLLSALAYHGGPTKTLALLEDSPAFGAGDNTATTTAGLTTDQRGTGFPRQLGANVESGALEQNALPKITVPAAGGFTEATSTGGAVVNFSVSALDLEDGDVAATAVPASGTTFAIGDTTVTVTATDSLGGVAQKTFVVTVKDTTAPTLTLAAGDAGLRYCYPGTLPDFRGGVTALDLGITPTVTQDPAPGVDAETAFPAGAGVITLTAEDAAGNKKTLNLSLEIRANGATHSVLLSPGVAAPGHGVAPGLPDEAKLTSFNAPAVSGASDLAYLAKWASSPKVKGTGLFLNSDCLGLVGGAVPGITGAKFASFTDPVVDASRVAAIAKLIGTPKPPASVVVSNALGATTLTVIARAGDVAPAADGSQPTGGAKFKTFKAVSIYHGHLAIFAQLTGGTGLEKAGPLSDLGLYITDDNGLLRLVLREGRKVAPADTKIIKTITSFAVGNGSPGQGRGWLSDQGGPVALALVTYTDKSQEVVAAGVGAVTRFTRTAVTGPGGPAIPDATFASYSFPTTNDHGTVAFLASLTPGPGGATAATARGIFITDPLSQFVPLARVGRSAGLSGAPTVKFSTLKDPVLASDDGLAFTATLTGGSVKGLATATLWWLPPGEGLQILAQGGQRPGPDLPALAQWKSFTSLAIAGHRGPLFAASMLPGKGGVTAANANGVWGTDFNGTPRLLFRAGVTQIGGKPLQSFTLLKATLGNLGLTRSFNDKTIVVWLATFKDKSTALIRTLVP